VLPLQLRLQVEPEVEPLVAAVVGPGPRVEAERRRLLPLRVMLLLRPRQPPLVGVEVVGPGVVRPAPLRRCLLLLQQMLLRPRQLPPVVVAAEVDAVVVAEVEVVAEALQRTQLPRLRKARCWQRFRKCLRLESCGHRKARDTP